MITPRKFSEIGKTLVKQHAASWSYFSVRNLNVRQKNHGRGEKVDDGAWVSAGSILVRQLGLQYFPGRNVGLGRNRDLYAMEHGYVYKTTEKVKPNWNSRILYNYFGQYEDHPEIPLYRTYFHVIPEPMPQTFKLVDQN